MAGCRAERACRPLSVRQQRHVVLHLLTLVCPLHSDVKCYPTPEGVLGAYLTARIQSACVHVAQPCPRAVPT